MSEWMNDFMWCHITSFSKENSISFFNLPSLWLNSRRCKMRVFVFEVAEQDVHVKPGFRRIRLLSHKTQWGLGGRELHSGEFNNLSSENRLWVHFLYVITDVSFIKCWNLSGLFLALSSAFQNVIASAGRVCVRHTRTPVLDLTSSASTFLTLTDFSV